MSRVHLFNCDNTYKLEPVEQLLTATKKKLETELGIHVDSVKKHPFRLAQMSDMVTKTIPTLKMDMAFFVVHAHESRLSINEDNAGIGYAKIYRALLQATGGNVIIVIGGDDNYKDADEEDRDFISRWAKRKISSQFSEEYLDGRKSFIFSWNKKHRDVHEAALLHYFDPSKKGQKFQYQPPPRKQPPKPVTPHSARSRKPTPPLTRCSSLQEEGKYDSKLLSRLKSSWHSEEGTTGQSAVDEEEQNQDRRFSSTENRSTYRDRVNTAPSTRNQEAESKEMLPQSTGKTRDLAILGCNVSPVSMADVMNIFKKIGPRLHLSEDPVVENLQPMKVEQFLMVNQLKLCVLVVDASTVKDGYENQKSVEYQQLLETAMDKVVVKVVILVCNRNTLNLPPEDEDIISKTIERIVNKRGKGFVVELRNGKLGVDLDVLIKVLMLPMPAPIPDEQMNRSRGFLEPVSNAGTCSIDLQQFAEGHLQRDPLEGARSHGKGAQNTQQLASQAPAKPSIVVLRSLVRFGTISHLIGELQIWDPEFEIPKYIQESLFQKYRHTPLIGVRIYKNSDGTIGWAVDPKLEAFSLDSGEIQLATNEKLVLKTRVRNGEVSFDEIDVQFKYGNLGIPQHVLDSFRNECKKKPYGDLYIISDETGKFRCIVKSGIKDQASSAIKQKMEQFDSWQRKI